MLLFPDSSNRFINLNIRLLKCVWNLLIPEVTNSGLALPPLGIFKIKTYTHSNTHTHAEGVGGSNIRGSGY